MRVDGMEKQVERFLQRFQAVGPDCSLIAAWFRRKRFGLSAAYS